MKFKWFRLLLLLCLTPAVLLAETNPGKTVYENQLFGFRLMVPADWTLAFEEKNDTQFRESYCLGLVSFSLPKVWSDKEKDNIQNVVTVAAYNGPAIRSLNDIIHLEKVRIQDDAVSMEEIAIADDTKGYIIQTNFGKVVYKTKTMFYYKNKIGYIISFTATPDTYDRNIGKFERFLKTVSFIQPKKP